MYATSSPEHPAAQFRDAAVRLDHAQPNDEAWGAAAREAASALVELARRDPKGDSLIEFLAPTLDASWTVLCYEAGDVTPVESVDFSSADGPARAVLRCADCGHPDHVHAELVVSDDRGTRWTALTRHRDDLEFEPPDLQTVLNEADDAGAQAAVLAQWGTRVGRWGRAGTPRAPVHPVRSGAVAPRPTLGQRIEARLEEVEHRHAELREEIDVLRGGLESLHADVREILRLVSEQQNASVATVARALRDRWVK